MNQLTSPQGPEGPGAPGFSEVAARRVFGIVIAILIVVINQKSGPLAGPLGTGIRVGNLESSGGRAPSAVMIENHLDGCLGDVDQGEGDFLALRTLRDPIHPDHSALAIEGQFFLIHGEGEQGLEKHPPGLPGFGVLEQGAEDCVHGGSY